MAALEEDDIIRLGWERHAAECLRCGQVLNDIRLAEKMLSLLPSAPEPFIAAKVLAAAQRKSIRFEFGPRQIAMGVVGSVIGVVLGFLLADFEPRATLVQPGAVYTMAIMDLSDGFEDMLSVIAEAISETGR